MTHLVCAALAAVPLAVLCGFVAEVWWQLRMKRRRPAQRAR